MRIEIEYQDQFGSWKHFQTKHNEADAFRVASRRAQSTGKRHRLVSDDGALLDLIDPSRQKLPKKRFQNHRTFCYFVIPLLVSPSQCY